MLKHLGNKLKLVGTFFQRSMSQSLLHSEHHLSMVGAIGFIGFPLFFFIWKYALPQPYENMPLRILGGLLCFGLITKPYWPKRYLKYFPLYWYITILYSLPFFFFFFMLKNQSMGISPMSMLMAIFLIILLVDWVSLVILTSIGFTLAWITFKLTTHPASLPINLWQDLIVYLFTIITGTVFNYKTALLHQKKLEGMATLSGNVAHELRTPLLGVKSGIAGVKRYLPLLLETYIQAKEQGMEVPKIRVAHLNNLVPVLERMDSEIYYANTIIDMLLMNVGRSTINPSTFSLCSMMECVEEALQRYPFEVIEKRNKIHWNPANNFYFLGSKLYVVHILFNLLKNALFFIEKIGKGEIYIWLEEGKKWNYLYFKDTGAGIPGDVLPQLFQRFFTTTMTGTGVGLSFCKLVMLSFEGDIICRSEEGQFTEFVLKFPKS